MTALRPGTPLYDAVFAGVSLPSSFVAQGPTYETIKNGFLDISNEKLFSEPGVTNAAQSKDIRTGMQLVVKTLSVDFKDGKFINFPSSLIPAARSVLASSEIAPSIDDLGVARIFDAAVKGDAVGVAGAVIATGMAAAGIAVPVVGFIGALIVGMTTGLRAIFQAKAAGLAEEIREHRALLYRSFPPLQEADAALDGKLVDVIMLPQLRERDWTRIYRPRFQSEDWVGIEREGGFAFAPGTRTASTEKFGGKEAFAPSAEPAIFDAGHTEVGLGCIPGTTEVTAVVQVSLENDPNGLDNAAWLSFLKGGPDPRSISQGVPGWTRVHDTGMYYPATGRLAGAMWSLALAPGSPYKYRLDAVKLHDRWRRWAEGGLRYIREVCYPWWPSVADGNGRIAVGKDTNFEGFYGTGIFYSVGAWAGLVDKKKSTTQHLVYKTLEKPKGIAGPELVRSLNAYGAVGSPISSTYSGAFLPILDPARWPDQCMGTIYDRATNIKATLDQLQAAQRWDLQHTLVSASVSVRDAAFMGDPKLMDLLLKLRAKLLTSEDRFAIDINDVAPDEPGLGGMKHPDSWRKQLIASGVPMNPSRVAHGLTRLAPPGGRPPPKPPFHGGPPNPWDPQAGVDLGVAPPPKPRKSSSGIGVGLGVMGGLTGVALAAAFALRRRPRRGLSAGRSS